MRPNHMLQGSSGQQLNGDSATHAQPPLSARYQRHQPENTIFYPIIEQNLPALRDALQQREASLPGFVLAEFDDSLRCGQFEHGFVRVKCNGYLAVIVHPTVRRPTRDGLLVEQTVATFQPYMDALRGETLEASDLEDSHSHELRALIEKKRWAGKDVLEAQVNQEDEAIGAQIVDLMEYPKKSIGGGSAEPTDRSKRPRKAPPG